MGFAKAMLTAMMAAIGDGSFSVVPVMNSIATIPQNVAGMTAEEKVF